MWPQQPDQVHAAGNRLVLLVLAMPLQDALGARHFGLVQVPHELAAQVKYCNIQLAGVCHFVGEVDHGIERIGPGQEVGGGHQR